MSSQVRPARKGTIRYEILRYLGQGGWYSVQEITEVVCKALPKVQPISVKGGINKSVAYGEIAKSGGLFGLASMDKEPTLPLVDKEVPATEEVSQMPSVVRAPRPALTVPSNAPLRMLLEQALAFNVNGRVVLKETLSVEVDQSLRRAMKEIATLVGNLLMEV